MRFKIIGVAGVTALALAGLATPAYADDHTASVSVLHAVPDTPVDVYVGGERILNDFEPATRTAPHNLAPGRVEVPITAADADDDSDPVIGPLDVTVEEDMSYTIVAHLNADGDPTAKAFVNDTSGLDAGQGRLTVRHVAAAPAVDILAGGDAVISGLENPDEESLELDAGTIEASVAAAGETDALIGPADVTVTEGELTIVYAWGSAEDDNLALAVQTVSGMGSDPSGADAGEAGLAADSGLTPYLLAAAALFGAALLVSRRSMAQRVRAER